MLEAMLARLSMATSLMFGRSFSIWALDRLVEAARETRHEFGLPNQKDADLRFDLDLDEAERHQVQLQRFRQQATKAVRETIYYKQLFEGLRLNPKQLDYDQIAQIPTTPRQALNDRPEAFVSQSSNPYFGATTTGTTGRPTRVYFSQHEIRVYSALQALSYLLDPTYDTDDVIINCAILRGSISYLCFTGSAAATGATILTPGVVEPEQTLRLLTDPIGLIGKRTRPSVLFIYPSSLGELIECGWQQGYRPQDFGLRKVLLGGEIVTEGLKRRVQELFGPVPVVEGYGMTEIWPLEGRLCEHGHLHFEPGLGLVEVIEPETRRPALQGQLGMLVATPLPPFRETTLLLRYETQDLVQVPINPLSCSLANQPATSPTLGKLRLSVRIPGGWITPRPILEALEGLDDLPLPARFHYRSLEDGIAVTALARQDTTAVRSALGSALEKNGVPLRDLVLVTNRRDLQRAYPLRCDLREATFTPE